MGSQILSDNYFMNMALKEAQIAYEKDEVPVGAVVVYDDLVIAKAHNQVETLSDVTAHAEILAYTSASNHIGSKFLTQCTLYVTLEPCVMCAGAIFWGRIGRLVYGADDDKKGYTLYKPRIIHPGTVVTAGILAGESGALLKSFFKSKRSL